MSVLLLLCQRQTGCYHRCNVHGCEFPDAFHFRFVIHEIELQTPSFPSASSTQIKQSERRPEQPHIVRPDPNDPIRKLFNTIDSHPKGGKKSTFKLDNQVRCYLVLLTAVRIQATRNVHLTY
jgi:hypothetical protein